jgi:hypothetical protein
MKAVLLTEYGSVEGLELREVADPQPGPNEIKVRMAGASINPIDWKMRSGSAQKRTPSCRTHRAAPAMGRAEQARNPAAPTWEVHAEECPGGMAHLEDRSVDVGASDVARASTRSRGVESLFEGCQHTPRIE